MADNTNYFEIFQLPVSPDLDLKKLEHQYKVLQQAAHPDQFSGESEQQKHAAVQYISHVNQAYKQLKDPVERCQYLMTLFGYNKDTEQTTINDTDFLMKQMELREEIEELKENASDSKIVKLISVRVQKELQNYLSAFKNIWSTKEYKERIFLEEAISILKKLQFLNKILLELRELEQYVRNKHFG